MPEVQFIVPQTLTMNERRNAKESEECDTIMKSLKPCGYATEKGLDTPDKTLWMSYLLEQCTYLI